MTPHPTLRDWLALPVEARRERLAGVIEHAASSRRTHGVHIAVADAAPPARAGLLESIPFGVKDNVDVVGFDTTAGTPFLVGSRPARDAGVVHLLRDEGAAVVGKTNLHELAFGITSDNATFGPTRNPADPTLSAGGSSGGSAASVAIGDVPFSLGTDTGGSVTVPASFCGVVGFRPTTGRYPGDGVVALSWSCDTIGVHAATVDDVALVDRLVVGGRAAPGAAVMDDVRLGLPRSCFRHLDPRVRVVVGTAVEALRCAGVVVVEVEDDDAVDATAVPGSDLVVFETSRTLLAHVGTLEEPFQRLSLERMAELAAGDDVRQALGRIIRRAPDVARYDRARAARWRFRRDRRRMMADAGVDALLYPSSPVLPPRLGGRSTVELDGLRLPVLSAVGRHAGPGPFAGSPMLAVPAGRTGGLPVGVTLEGTPGDDDRLLSVGRVVERILRADGRAPAPDEGARSDGPGGRDRSAAE